MIYVTYRLIGNVDYPQFTKEFDSPTSANAWIFSNPILVVSIEAS